METSACDPGVLVHSKLTRVLACLTIAAAVLGASPAAQQVKIPIEYRGEWTNEPRYCGVERDNLDSVLTVTAGSVGYFENEWRVKSVQRTGKGIAIRYHPRADFDMYAPNYLRLSADRQRIYTSDDRRDTGYKRCPRKTR
ncbi:MAG TPA: hypothetical protein VFV30_12535 [Novosphingobium sp.]|nr:hypothetical protein [Novosphingobium sp.]